MYSNSYRFALKLANPKELRNPILASVPTSPIKLQNPLSNSEIIQKPHYLLLLKWVVSRPEAARASPASLLKMQGLRPSANLLNQTSHFIRLPEGSVCTFKLEKLLLYHTARPVCTSRHRLKAVRDNNSNSCDSNSNQHLQRAY